MNQNGPRLFDGPGFGRPSPARFRQVMDGRGAEYAADYFEYTVGANTIAANSTTILTLNIERNAAFEWMTLKGGGVATNDTSLNPAATFLVTISDSASGRNLMNAPTPLSALCGGNDTFTGNQFPFVLPIARRFMPATQVSIALTEIAGTTWDNITLTFGGRKIWMDQFSRAGGPPPLQRFNLWQSGDGRVLCEDLFFFTFDTGAGGVPHNTPGVPITQIMQADGDLEWILTQAVQLQADNTFAPAMDGPLFVQVRDVGCGRDLFSQATPAANMSGWEGVPYILPIPRITLAKSPVTVTFTNPLPGAGAIARVWLTMAGRKLFEQD